MIDDDAHREDSEHRDQDPEPGEPALLGAGPGRLQPGVRRADPGSVRAAGSGAPPAGRPRRRGAVGGGPARAVRRRGSGGGGGLAQPGWPGSRAAVGRRPDRLVRDRSAASVPAVGRVPGVAHGAEGTGDQAVPAAFSRKRARSTTTRVMRPAATSPWPSLTDTRNVSRRPSIDSSAASARPCRRPRSARGGRAARGSRRSSCPPASVAVDRAHRRLLGERDDARRRQHGHVAGAQRERGVARR